MDRWTLKLNTDTQIDLDIRERNWTQATLSIAGTEYPLGADVFAIICERFLAAFKNYANRETKGSIDGVRLVWVLTLSETHTSIYLGKHSKGAILLFQDRDGKQLATVNVECNVVEVFESIDPNDSPDRWLQRG